MATLEDVTSRISSEELLPHERVVSSESGLKEKLGQSWESLIWKVIGVDCQFFLEKELFNVD